jgi:hypothetical protein
MSSMKLPRDIGSRVRLQSADTDGWAYLCWRGFVPETLTLDGFHTMRRDFHDHAFAHHREPPPPRFPVEIMPLA